MGLMVHSLEAIREGHHRDYYIYLLDYGWHEPLSDALKSNFNKMATLASEQDNAVVIMRTDEGIHFNDEVLSWHSINGEDVEQDQLLPAILITIRHPVEFRKRAMGMLDKEGEERLKLILIPLKKHCSSTRELIDLIKLIFLKIKQGEDLGNFVVTKEKTSEINGASITSLVIEPNFKGQIFTHNRLLTFFSNE